MTIDEERASAARELSWLLTTLTSTLISVRTGLTECLDLLSPANTSTLPFSTPRSEVLKGFITRSGPQITRGELSLHLQRQRGKLSVRAPWVLEQLVDVENYVLRSLELVANGAFREGEEEKDPKSTMQLLQALQENVSAARAALRAASAHRLFPFHAVDPKVFEPPLVPGAAAFSLHIAEASLVVEVRTLEPVAPADNGRGNFLAGIDISPFGFRERFAAAVGIHHGPASRAHASGEEEVVSFNGTKVRVKEVVRVESQDPSLMAAWAKLGGLEHVLAGSIDGNTEISFVMSSL
ncbi:RAVE subunit 2/Rogdi [Sphaerosporella brunnea]|uniref:RAVE subunit 2/Rogdi n=1 Tax=Sphaerosporella brunnea TaxID=1250544 RepID=A0A5J5FC18_9PEZI|nr:RAVE subunit 2/Rogdi [Sphaerosporella brunnea]